MLKTLLQQKTFFVVGSLFYVTLLGLEFLMDYTEAQNGCGTLAIDIYPDLDQALSSFVLSTFKTSKTDTKHNGLVFNVLQLLCKHFDLTTHCLQMCLQNKQKPPRFYVLILTNKPT